MTADSRENASTPSDPAEQPDVFADPAEAGKPTAHSRAVDRSHLEKDPLTTGRTEPDVNPRTWFSGWDLRQLSVGLSVTWLLLLLLLTALVLEYVADGLVSHWASRIISGADR